MVVRIKHGMTRLQISKTNGEAELNATRAREKFWHPLGGLISSLSMFAVLNQ